jgi:DNA-binding transcriptional LysR family regulator
MDWDNARIFLAVARSGQMLGAAKKLGIDHATVARRVSALEADLKTKLFERRTTGCVLTAPGERFLTIAERIESEVFQAQDQLANADLALSGVVRIGAPDGFGTYVLAPALGALADQHPDLVIQLVPLPRLFSVTKREADIAVTIERPTEGRLTVRKLTDYSLHLYASAALLARKGPIETVQDLARHTLVTYVSDYLYSPALDYADAVSRHTSRRYECASVVAQLEAVRAGVGVAVVHDYAVRDDPGMVRVLPELTFKRTYWMVTHRDVGDLRRVVAVQDFVVQLVRKQRSRFQ